MPRKTVKRRRHRKMRRGGSDYEDIEMGRLTPVKPIGKLPPRPERIREHELRQIQRSFNPVSKMEVEKVFNGPTPEQRQVLESHTMLDEDPRFQDAFHREELRIFNRGGRHLRRSRKKRRTRRGR